MKEEKTLDIQDRNLDYQEIMKQARKLDEGFRAISTMYNDHKFDNVSTDRIYEIKDNLFYRLSSYVHQYKILLKSLNEAESFLKEKGYKEVNKFILGNPYFEKIDLEICSVFDNVIFHLTSFFDYFSHYVCFIILKNKQSTKVWTKFARTCRGKVDNKTNTHLESLIDELDKLYVGILYDYRSDVIHKYRDKHSFTMSYALKEGAFEVQMLSSEKLLKTFKKIITVEKNQISLAYLASTLIKQSFISIDLVLKSLEKQIRLNSNFQSNVSKAGDSKIVFFSLDPVSKIAGPVSDKLWENYLKN